MVDARQEWLKAPGSRSRDLQVQYVVSDSEKHTTFPASADSLTHVVSRIFKRTTQIGSEIPTLCLCALARQKTRGTGKRRETSLAAGRAPMVALLLARHVSPPIMTTEINSLNW